MTDAETVLIDTSVLLTATSAGRADHERALLAVASPSELGFASLFTSSQVMREYLAVATRPESTNGLGLSVETSLQNVRDLTARMELLAEDAATVATFFDMVHEFDLKGKRIHDANLAATAIFNGVEAILTQNVADFAVLSERIEILDLASLPA